MCHFVREVEGAIELRTRVWMGWHIVDDRGVKILSDGIQLPMEVPRALCAHAAKEFTNLARLLPRIFEGEKGIGNKTQRTISADLLSVKPLRIPLWTSIFKAVYSSL